MASGTLLSWSPCQMKTAGLMAPGSNPHGCVQRCASCTTPLMPCRKASGPAAMMRSRSRGSVMARRSASGRLLARALLSTILAGSRVMARAC